MVSKAKWNNFVDTVGEGVEVLAKNTFKDFVAQAKEDTQEFWEDSEETFKRWVDALATGKLTKDEFEFLVGMRADLAKMHALTAAGVSMTRIERFRTGVISLFTKTIFDTLL